MRNKWFFTAMGTILIATGAVAQNVTIGLTLGQTVPQGTPLPPGVASCAPCIVGTGDGKPGYENSWSNGTVVTVTAGTATTSIPMFRMDFWGHDTETDIIFTPAGDRNDQLYFVDFHGAWNNTGRSGTAALKWGTGVFHDAAGGSISYTYTCTAICYNGVGDPGHYTFRYQLTGGGFFNISLAAAKDALPSLYPTLLQQVENQTVNSTNSVFLGGDPNNPFGDGKAIPHSSAASSAPGGSIVVTPPWQAQASTYNATASCPNLTSTCWLSIPQGTGSMAAFTSAPVTANLNPGNLGPGVYPANISMTVSPGDGSSPATSVVPVNMVVTNGGQLLKVSEPAVQFQALAGAPSPLVHSIAVASSGSSFAYQAAASTLSGGNWLSVSPASGTASYASPGSVTIQANPAGLAAGSYFGKVDIAAAGTVGSPQSVEVELTVASGGTAPIFSTTGLLFVTPQNVNPGSQSITISTFSSAPIGITAAVSPDTVQTWLTAFASGATVQAGAPMMVTMVVDVKGLTPGAYPTTFYAQNATGANYPINVVLIVTPAAGGCTPTQLLPVFTNLMTNFELPAGVPISLQATITDDCGNLLNSGSVQASFGSTDAPVTLTAAGNGRWAGTWLPGALVGGPTSIAINAQSPTVQGSTSVAGLLDANPLSTVVTPGGIISAASLVAGAPVAPGEFISIFGANLANTTASSPSYPLAKSLAGTQVLLAGQPLPLQFVSPGQINAIIPYGTAVNGYQELLVQQNNVYAMPQSVIVATANPAVFTQNQSGQGPGVIVAIQPDGTQFEISPTQPAAAGDVLVIYCSGLGPVNPPVADGAAASLSTLSNTVNPVTVTVGGQAAKVLFAGLAPGFAGLYQVNAVVPAGITAGPIVPVLLTTSGFSSAPVTVAIQ